MTADDSNTADAGSPSELADQSRAERRALEVESAHRRKRRTAMVLAPLLLVAAAGTGVALWNRDGDTPGGQAGEQAGAARTGSSSTPGAPSGVQAPSAGAPSSAKNCPSRTPITVWAPAALASSLTKTASDFQATDAAPCVTYTVAAKNPTQTLAGLGQGEKGRPDAWVSDASVWVDQVNATGKLKVTDRTPFATSPLVVAMNPARAAALKAVPTWAQIIKPDSPIAISNPLSTTAGMLTISSALPRLSLRQGRGRHSCAGYGSRAVYRRPVHRLRRQAVLRARVHCVGGCPPRAQPGHAQPTHGAGGPHGWIALVRVLPRDDLERRGPLEGR